MKKNHFIRKFFSIEENLLLEKLLNKTLSKKDLEIEAKKFSVQLIDNEKILDDENEYKNKLNKFNSSIF